MSYGGGLTRVCCYGISGVCGGFGTSHDLTANGAPVYDVFPCTVEFLYIPC